ncbi:MAG: hypothetical protein ACRDZR_10565 [Acidimicrobiales bacterium]
MHRRLHRILGIVASLVLTSLAAGLPAAAPAGASLPSTLTFGSGSVLDVRIGVISLDLSLATGNDGTDPRGSVAVTVTGSHFTSATPFGVPGNAGDSLTRFPAGTITGTLTGTSITTISFATATGSSPEVTFETLSTGLQDCVIEDAYTEVYTGSTGSLTATTATSTFRTHATAANATTETCPSTLATYLDTYSAEAKVSGSVSVS